MTSGVVMLLTGPLQSWGGPAPGIYERGTGSMPSLSGIIGMVSNALGRKRTDPIDDLAAGARLAVRADRPGTPMEDFHTLGNVLNAEGKLLRYSVPTRRWYLQDAAFLAVYTPPVGGMPADEILDALNNPRRPLYLGRRSCPPAERVPVCVVADRTPEEVLTTAALLRETDGGSAPLSDVDYFEADTDVSGHVSALIEMSAPDDIGHQATLRPDAPTTFDPRRLAHMNRRVITKSIQVPAVACAGRGPEAVMRLRDSLGATP
ncbi:type I-E CRISPR-associated protein Cas5/CasD [Candidatus Poriferisodalis sp.]|uniref:type I-E CRISPR-associated protein Cas5/CasD n=1 Tax=Candidatus Poriferisodalis sp. TaxID=3101277 RepID=UPI003B0132B4